MVDMEPAVRTGKHKKINSGGNAENRKYTSSMDVVYLHRHCPEIKKTVENFKICVQFLLTSAPKFKQYRGNPRRHIIVYRLYSPDIILLCCFNVFSPNKGFGIDYDHDPLYHKPIFCMG